MWNEKIFCLLKKRVIKQAYGGVVEDLEDDVEPIINLNTNKVDNLVDSWDDNKVEEDVQFSLNNKAYFYK